jgi:flagellar basal-body rod modification protein FlgD
MIEALTNSSLVGNAPALSSKELAENNSQLKMDDFLQLLTSQITNQDPLEPMKDTEFISQMANIASLEQMQQFTQGFSKFADSHGEMLAQTYLGSHVQISSNNRDISGTVEAVDKLEDGSIKIVVDGQAYDPSEVRRVELKKDKSLLEKSNSSPLLDQLGSNSKLEDLINLKQ